MNTGLKKIEIKRSFMLFIAVLLLLNYLSFCYHTDKNPFDIFPRFPILEKKMSINIFIPDIDGKSILKEKRNIPVIQDREGYIRLLFKHVVKGSYFENTSLTVPIDAFIRKVWIYDQSCVIDLGLVIVDEDIQVIPGSEDTFRESIEKTITENIPSIRRVILLESGIPGRRIWDIAEL